MFKELEEGQCDYESRALTPENPKTLNPAVML